MTNNQPPFDHIRWWEFELKTRELYQKRYAEAYKQASEFSKLVLTNLHLINAGGLVALPWLATFTNTAGLAAGFQCTLTQTKPPAFLLQLLSRHHLSAPRYRQAPRCSQACLTLTDPRLWHCS